MTAYEDIRKFASGLEIIDTHEHLPSEAQWAKSRFDVLGEYLVQYFCCDLISAGLDPVVLKAVCDPATPVADRWRIVEPFWNAARNTGYARALDIAVRDLYGLPRIDGSTIEELNSRFLARRQAAASGKSHYHYVFKEKSRIAVSLVDDIDGWARSEDKRFFRYVFRMHHLVTVNDPVKVDRLSQSAGIPVHGLSDWMDLVEKSIDDAVAKGAVALKCALAYERPIRFAKTAFADAEAAFNKLLGIPRGFDVGEVLIETRPVLEDFLMHHVCRLADKRGLTFQIHTGIQEGNGNILANSNPELLTNLFLEYSNVTFDVFHMGYPFEHSLSAIAKNFRNVMIDMCWAHIVSPEASVRALVEFLDAVPANKISAFGGDYLFPDGVYGHQFIARDNVAKALAAKVADGCFDLDRAKEICRWLLVDNPKRIFKL
jgi:hypothetical protein